MGNTMIRLKYIVSVLAWVIGFTGWSQSLVLTNEAAKLCQEMKLDAALEKSNMALADKTESIDAYCWYVNGYVLKEIYKNREYGLLTSEFRENAMKSFSYSMSLKNADQHASMTRLAMKYLASTYYNDALQASQSNGTEAEQEAYRLFETFEKWMPTAEPGVNMMGYRKEFTKSIGQRYFSLEQYEKIVKLDSEDVDAYYNLSVIHYNQAVFMYRKINHETDMFDMMTIQETASKLIREKALPLMDKAYALAPEKGEVVHGKIILHRALDHEKDVEYFKQEIARLVREGKIKSDSRK
jgi:tetratricopeptide (TPR) repeat protein